MEFFVISIVAIVGTISFMGYEGSFKRLAKLEDKVCMNKCVCEERAGQADVLVIGLITVSLKREQ